MSGVVVDTCVWIDFFAGRSADRLLEALQHGIVVLPPLVASELINGVRRSSSRGELVELLEELSLAHTPLSHWIRVGDLRRQCKQKGLSVSTPDAHVAQCALDIDALLLSHDAVFSRIAKHTRLRVGRA